ncbi:hypothetical protein ACFQU2_08990 [Siccirubricoccus deserti]
MRFGSARMLMSWSEASASTTALMSKPPGAARVVAVRASREASVPVAPAVVMPISRPPPSFARASQLKPSSRVTWREISATRTRRFTWIEESRVMLFTTSRSSPP